MIVKTLLRRSTQNLSEKRILICISNTVIEDGYAVRNLWLPIVLILIVLIAIGLGITGLIPGCFPVWLQKWQPLAAAGVASVAAYIAFQNTTRSLRHAERLENNRRNQKHSAVRAILPLALSQVLAYAERSARALSELVGRCEDDILPAMTAPENLVEPLPSETLKALADFIEYSDKANVTVLEATIALIQIHDSRLRGLVEDNRDPSETRIVVLTEIENRIIDAASIYAGAASIFDYARRRSQDLPTTMTWDSVARALRNMRFWDEEHPQLYEALAQREAMSLGPFENPTARTE
jgi:hypothetical protein